MGKTVCFDLQTNTGRRSFAHAYREQSDPLLAKLVYGPNRFTYFISPKTVIVLCVASAKIDINDSIKYNGYLMTLIETNGSLQTLRLAWICRNSVFRNDIISRLAFGRKFLIILNINTCGRVCAPMRMRPGDKKLHRKHWHVVQRCGNAHCRRCNGWLSQCEMQR